MFEYLSEPDALLHKLYHVLFYFLAASPLFILFAGVLWLVYTRRFHPLADIPGPYLASITRLWYVRQVQHGKFDEVNRILHKKYGPLVRISPSEVSINDPDAVNIIYGTKSSFTKTDFYPVWRAEGIDTKHVDQFTDLDEVHHAARRRLLNNIYSMSSILEAEPYIDACTELFMERVAGFAKSGEVMDLGLWAQMYAFDVLGELFFGSPFGFLETSSDFGGWIGALDRLMPVLCTVALLPRIFRPFYLVYGIAFASVRRGLKAFSGIPVVAKQRVVEREQAMQATGSEKQPLRNDLLAKLFSLSARKGDKEDFHVPDIQMEGYVGLLAGSDTTAIAMRAILYQLLTHPEIMTRLMAELEKAHASGSLSIPIKYSEATKLPLFAACVKEAMRLHPSVGLQLPRYPPTEGIELAGHFFPNSSRVGINAAVLHYNKDVFGADADVFNPGRWLTDQAAYMDRHLLTFGGGSRTCIGKSISISEIYKMIPHLLLKFRLELRNPETPLTKHDFWFHKQDNFIVRVHERSD